MSTVQLKFKRVREGAHMPTFGTEGAACFDLYACLPFEPAINTCTPHQRVTIGTGLAFEVPPGYAMMIYSRSGQGFKENTRLSNCVGVIDSDYRGEVRVALTRDDMKGLFICQGDRIAQAMLIPVPSVLFEEVEELSETVRGTGAYGSTGR
jgi:dUTP pyrophosphatase